MRLLPLLALLAALPAQAAEPADLTESLAPRPQVGDYKVWEGRGVAAVREDVTAVEDAADGYRIVRRYSNQGVEVATSEELVTPGVQTTLQWIAVVGRRPDAWPLLGIGNTLPLSARPGQRFPYKSSYDPWFPLIHRVTRGSHRYVGVEDWVSRSSVHPLAAILVSRSSTRSWRSGSDWIPVWSERVETKRLDRAYAPGVRLVGAEVTYRTLVRGQVTKRTTMDLELSDAVVRGAPYPPQD